MKVNIKVMKNYETNLRHINICVCVYICALSRADNSADMKNPCDNLYIACLVSIMQCFI